MFWRTCPSIEPCLPRPAKEPPIGAGWIHEIKHDGFRIMARRDGSRVRLISRIVHDLTYRFPSVAAAIAALPVRSCLIDGEAIVCNSEGLAVFQFVRNYRRSFLDRTQTTVCDESIGMAGLDKAILNDVGVELLRCPCSSRGVTYECGCPRPSSNTSRFKRIAQSQSTRQTHKWQGFMPNVRVHWSAGARTSWSW
jgi:hypothetical protein